MNSRRHIRLSKVIKENTAWKNGCIPKKCAPFLKAAMPLGANWYWRSAMLTSLKENKEYHLLVMLNIGKPNFKAWLAVKTELGYTIVARYEYHSNHGGFHLHYLCNQEAYPLGEIDPENAISIPHYKRAKPTPLAKLSQADAWNKALKMYRIGKDDKGQLNL